MDSSEPATLSGYAVAMGWLRSPSAAVRAAAAISAGSAPTARQTLRRTQK